MTRYDSYVCASSSVKVAVIGDFEGVIHVIDSLADNANYICKTVIIESKGYYGGRLWKSLLRSGTGERLRIAARMIRLKRKVRQHKDVLSRVGKVYFTSSDTSSAVFNEIPGQVFDGIDLFFVAEHESDFRFEYKTSDYAVRLMEYGISKEKIFIVPSIMRSAEIPVFSGSQLSPLCKNLLEVKPILRYMEYQLTDFCNLKCKGCSHLAQYVNEVNFAGAENFRSVLEKLSKKFGNITILRLLGGEPLICRELHEYINAAHEVFPYSQIKIVTNGLLYKRITDLTVKAIKEAGAEIEVSQYHPTRKIINDIVAFCDDNGVKLSISGLINEFYRWSPKEKNENLRHIWSTCISRYCHFLRCSTLTACPRVWAHHDERFRDFITNETITDREYQQYSYDLSQDIHEDGWDILRKIETPIEVCRKCGAGRIFFKWESEAGIR